MIRDQDRFRLFGRRAVLLAGGKLMLFSALAARMYYLQVVEAERYKTLADDNRINLRLLAPPRGRILDRNGVEIAANQKNYRLILVSERSPDVKGTLDRISKIIHLDDYDRRRVFKEIRRKRNFGPVTVRENLDWKDVAKIEVNAPDLPGVHIEVGQTRYYPWGEATAHLVGYVGAVSQKELTGDPLLGLPSFRVGKNGVEKIHDESLRGRAGRSEVEVNAVGHVIRELSRKEGQPGDELALTIDMGLQEFAHKRLGDNSASVAVMDIHNGDIMALASAPGFDPNAFNKGVSKDYWRELIGNNRAPLTNKAIAGQYAPGSTFKLIVGLAALEAGVIKPAHTTFCKGYVQLGNVRFHCWKKHGHGHLDLIGALQQSCDIYFYDIAKRVGVDRISAMAARFGMGKKLGIDVPGEKPGLMPSRGWKRAVLGKSWQLGETLVAGIGQGFVLSTPLQLAVMTARIANGGRAVVPRVAAALSEVASKDGPDGSPLVGGVESEEPPKLSEFDDIGVSEESMDVIRQGMFAVSNSPRGTAYRARIKEDKWRLAGKTGTSQVKRISMAERERGVLKNKQRLWKDRDHALFVAYAPVDAPRFAISVVVEHGGGGSTAAAPIARDIMREALKRSDNKKSKVPKKVAKKAQED
jgi:penicillin-binding protein 2